MSLINYIVYESTTGRVMWTGTCIPDDLSLQAAAPNSTVLQIDDMDPVTQFIDISTDEVIDKPAMPTTINQTSLASDGVDEIVISSVIAGTVVEVLDPDGVRSFITVDDGTFEMTTTDHGDFLITLRLFPYLEKEYTVGTI